MTFPSKSIFISYAEPDQRVALDLHSVLKKLLGDDVWIRELDLNGGEIVIEAINDAVTAAKWFIILVSASGAASKYLRMEADWASFRAVEDLGVRLIVVRLDKSALPKHLEIALGSQYVVDLSSSSDIQGDFLQIAEYIDRHIGPIEPWSVYVDRGEKSDEFSLVVRQNLIIFVLGVAGIGKSSFVSNSVAAKLRKAALTEKLTRGHSLDLLCRSLMRLAHTVQPSADTKDEELLHLAVAAIKLRADRFFVFLDDAEHGLDASGQLLPYLQQFLSAVIDSQPDTRVILATTRNPDIPAGIGAFSDLLQVYGLDKKYIREQIELLLGESDRTASIMSSTEIADLVPLLGGHPLAAKLLASFLKVKTPQQLDTQGEWRRFELKLAQHILQATDQTVLTPAEKLLLQVLAAVREPMLFEDIIASQELEKCGLEEVHAARSRLTDLFLIEQSGELMSLHPFLYTYFSDQLKELPELRDQIANDVGTYALRKAINLNEELRTIYEDPAKRESPDAIRTSRDVLRYAVPAGRLLRSIGKDDLAKQLPIQIKGTLRDMVFFFYQEKRDFRKALEYAEQWLEISPDDQEVAIQRARCYRTFRDRASLEKAEQILADLELSNPSPYFTARIYREKALVKESMNDRQGAKELFNKGISVNLMFPYIENYVGLASLLLKEADELPLYDPKQQALVRRALQFLATARKHQVVAFDRFHLGLYAEALVEAGEEETALPLLKDALRTRPRDERLNYRMAEILRKREQYDEALGFALASQRNGHPKAPVAIANIMFGQAHQAGTNSELESARILREALAVLSTFKPQYGGDQEIADTIAAKIHRTLGELNIATQLVAKYVDTANPYTIYEQSRIELLLSESAQLQGREKEAADMRQSAAARIGRYRRNHQLPIALQNLFNDLGIE
ncbi:MAG TPA: TIR domain-containing protein [Candidatus Angelobacter sp.]|jgi:tetratricopeptide (TPR) repeat protein